MLNLIQHLTKSTTYETLKQVQGDRLGLFTSPSEIESIRSLLRARSKPCPFYGVNILRLKPNLLLMNREALSFSRPYHSSNGIGNNNTHTHLDGYPPG